MPQTGIDLKKYRLWIVVILAFFVGFFAHKDASFMFLSNFVKENMSIIAVIFSPLIAWAVAEITRGKSESNKQKYEVLKTLMSYRHIKGSQEFLSALNRINLVFDRDPEIKEIVRNLWQSYVNNEDQKVRSQKEVELVYKIAKKMGFEISEFEIDNFFIQALPQQVFPIQIIKQASNGQMTPPPQSQTASVSGNMDINSITAGSITSGPNF